MSHAMIMIGSPVPKPKTIGKSQFHEKGSVIAMSTIVKKYTRRCGQNAIAKKIPNINIKNKRATFDYVFTETYTAGIVLTGTEIKSIRQSKASLVDTYCTFINNELWVKNMHVAEYFYGSYNNHVARRDRKLLLDRKELRKLRQAVKNPGFTIVPTRLFINEKGLAKLVIALARGKHEYDKRESIKERDDKREMDRIRRNF